MKRNPLLLLAPIIILLTFSCARKEKPAEPEFLVPPDNYRLVEIVRQDSLGNQSIIPLTYNALGKLDEENNVYDSLGRLTHSDWPGRPYSVRYVYNRNGLIDSIVTIGHTWNWYMVFYQTQLRLDRVSSYINGELNQRLFRDYISPDEYIINSLYGVDFRYVLDQGYSPYPEEYRLKNMWYPWNTALMFFNRNVKTIIRMNDDGSETVTNFEYKYNEYGYPTRMENLTNGEIKFFKYDTI